MMVLAYKENYIGMVATVPKLLSHSWKQGFGAQFFAILVRIRLDRIDNPDFRIWKSKTNV